MRIFLFFSPDSSNQVRRGRGYRCECPPYVCVWSPVAVALVSTIARQLRRDDGSSQAESREPGCHRASPVTTRNATRRGDWLRHCNLVHCARTRTLLHGIILIKPNNFTDPRITWPRRTVYRLLVLTCNKENIKLNIKTFKRLYISLRSREI